MFALPELTWPRKPVWMFRTSGFARRKWRLRKFIKLTSETRSDWLTTKNMTCLHKFMFFYNWILGATSGWSFPRWFVVSLFNSSFAHLFHVFVILFIHNPNCDKWLLVPVSVMCCILISNRRLHKVVSNVSCSNTCVILMYFCSEIKNTFNLVYVFRPVYEHQIFT